MNGIAGMHDSLNMASSALQTHSASVNISAHNIANVSTDGFEPWHVVNATGPGGKGVKTDALLRDGELLGRRPYAQVDDTNFVQTVGQSLRPSGTELAKEFVLMIDSAHAFDANAQVVRTADEMLGTLLNIKA